MNLTFFFCLVGIYRQFHVMIESVVLSRKKITLLELRHSKGLSQQQLSDLLDVGRSTISEWEQGKYLPTQDKIEKLAKVLGVEYEVLDVWLKARYHAKQLKLLGCSVQDLKFLYEQVA